MPSRLDDPNTCTTVTVGKITIKLSVDDGSGYDGCGYPSVLVSVQFLKKDIIGEVLREDGAVYGAISSRETFKQFDRQVDDFKFSARVRNCFNRNGIVFMGDLCQHTDYQLLKMKGFGVKCLQEVKDVLAAHRLDPYDAMARHWTPPRLTLAP